MPLFIYVCTKCEKIFEMMVPLARTGESIKCPKCKRKMKKIITPPNFKVN